MTDKLCTSEHCIAPVGMRQIRTSCLGWAQYSITSDTVSNLTSRMSSHAELLVVTKALL